MPMLLLTIDGSRLAIEPEDIKGILEFKEKRPVDSAGPVPGFVPAHCGIFLGPVQIKLAFTFDMLLAAIEEYIEESNMEADLDQTLDETLQDATPEELQEIATDDMQSAHGEDGDKEKPN